MQASGLGHGGQGHPLPTDVAEDLKHHEAEEEEVETGADPGHDDEGHLMHQSGKLDHSSAPKAACNAAETGLAVRRYSRKHVGRMKV